MKKRNILLLFAARRCLVDTFLGAQLYSVGYCCLSLRFCAMN